MIPLQASQITTAISQTFQRARRTVGRVRARVIFFISAIVRREVIQCERVVLLCLLLNLVFGG